jgi:hypothetical protein
MAHGPDREFVHPSQSFPTHGSFSSRIPGMARMFRSQKSLPKWRPDSLLQRDLRATAREATPVSVCGRVHAQYLKVAEFHGPWTPSACRDLTANPGEHCSA